MLPFRAYPSKLLLFGEYSVILGSEALAVPYQAFESQWMQGGDAGPALDDFVTFVQSMKEYDGGAMQEAIRAGWSYQSTIPIGYGLGSSGALCAAVYDAFRLEKETDINALRKSLATLEGFFHGSSSGTDPLISYLNAGIHLLGANAFEMLEAIPPIPTGLSIFLLDTGIPRSTAPLVKDFLSACTDSSFNARIREELSPLVQLAIQALREGQSNLLVENWKLISQFQWQWFRTLIPEPYHDLWQSGLLNDNCYLKLCGAGGGGFILGLSPKGTLIPGAILFNPYPASTE
ncbi:MAG: mevalonate kinase [Saprospiraceae bacterium]|nr:mevalonate kinase [Saprospiraceae bacterium]